MIPDAELQSLSAAILQDFVDRLRTAGLGIDLGRRLGLAAALDAAGTADLRSLHQCGRLTLCGSRDDVERYDRCFAAFFLGGGDTAGAAAQPADLKSSMPPGNSVLGADADDGPFCDVELGVASPAELLRNRRLTEVTGAERAQIQALIMRLQGRIAMRRSMRYRGAANGLLDVRKTARAAMSLAGEPARLEWRLRKSRPRKRVLLLDISGSMLASADGLLRFGYAAYRCAPHQTEVFTIGTRLTRITHFLRSSDPEAGLLAASNAIPDWSGGTRLADQLKAFLDQWGQRGMARGAVVVIASDGWERGDPQRLADQMRRLSRLANRIIWSNPHKSSQGFEPLCRGMQAALPYVDEFVAGNTANEFAQLLDLMGVDDFSRRARGGAAAPQERATAPPAAPASSPA